AEAESEPAGDAEQAPPAAAGAPAVGFGVPYVAFFPTATAEVSIEGRFFPLEVAGLQGSIVGIEPLMDKMVKPGINALFKLSKGPMAAAALVATACKFRMLREVIAGLAHHPKGYVYKKLLRDYPLVLSDK